MSNLFSRFQIQDILDYDQDKFEPHPYRAWAVIFFIGVIFVILVLTIHLYLYVHMRSGESFKSDDGPSAINTTKLNRKGLTEAIAAFEMKDAQFQKLLESPPEISDPSSFGGQSSSVKPIMNMPMNNATPKTSTSSIPVSF